MNSEPHRPTYRNPPNHSGQQSKQGNQCSCVRVRTKALMHDTIAIALRVVELARMHQFRVRQSQSRVLNNAFVGRVECNRQVPAPFIDCTNGSYSHARSQRLVLLHILSGFTQPILLLGVPESTKLMIYRLGTCVFG